MEETNQDWKTKLLVMGGVTGAIVGIVTAYLLARTAEEQNQGPPQIKTNDAIRIVLGIIGTVRGIADLGRKI